MGWSQVSEHPPESGGLFQSLRGFGVGWSASYRKPENAVVVVSIPERVWGGLEQPVGCENLHPRSLFQSLRGFGVGWSASS